MYVCALLVLAQVIDGVTGKVNKTTRFVIKFVCLFFFVKLFDVCDYFFCFVYFISFIRFFKFSFFFIDV